MHTFRNCSLCFCPRRYFVLSFPEKYQLPELPPPVSSWSSTLYHRMLVGYGTIIALGPSQEVTKRHSWTEVWPIHECSLVATASFLGSIPYALLCHRLGFSVPFILPSCQNHILHYRNYTMRQALRNFNHYKCPSFEKPYTPTPPREAAC